MGQKWQTVRSKSVLKDRWIDVRADHCRTAEGIEIGPYYVLSYPDWVHVVAITEAWLPSAGSSIRHAAGNFFLELPAGAVDPSDPNIEQAARRELAEETGFTAKHWELVSSLHPNSATHTNRVHTYLALDAVCDRQQSLDPGESGLTVDLVPIPVVLAGLKSGLLGQATHVSSALLGLATAGI